MFIRHRILGALLTSAALVGCHAFGGSYYPHRAELSETRQADLGGAEILDVQSRNGALTVLGEDRDDVHAELTRFARGSSEEDARQAVEKVTVEISKPGDGRTLAIVVRVPDSLKRRSAGANINLRIPRRLDLQAESSNGRIEVENLEGNVKAHSSNGSVRTTRIVGNVDLRTSNGRIDVDQVDARSILAVSSNGALAVRNSHANANGETSNGPFEFELLTLGERPQVSVRTSNGSVDVKLPASVAADLRLRTSNGKIRTALDGARVSGMSTSKRELEATLNGGGGRIEARTSNAGIQLSTR